MPQVEEDMYKIPKIREKIQTYTLKCVKIEDLKVIVQEKEIKEIWRLIMLVLFKIWVTTEMRKDGRRRCREGDEKKWRKKNRRNKRI